MNSDLQIDDAVKDLLGDLWKNRRIIWKDDEPASAIEALDPGVALHRLGFTIQLYDELGHGYFGGVRCLVAGTLDQREKHVSIARVFDYHSQRFTAAHEVAHAVLHPHLDILHRDVPLESAGYVRKREEIEANRFASRFLMPQRLVIEEFGRRFGPVALTLSEGSAFSLFCTTSVEKLRFKIRNQRDWAIAIARSTNYGANQFTSLHHHFTVSPTAMAIRLEELGLVPF